MNDSPSLLAEEARAYYEDLLRPVFASRKFLLIGPIAAGLRGLARQLTRLGAGRPFLIAANEGTGDLPPPEEAELRVLGIRNKDPIEEFRSLHRAIENMPADLRSDIDAWDPSGTARFIFPSPPDGATRRGRPQGVRGAAPRMGGTGRQGENRRAFWDAVGISRAPSRIAPAECPGTQIRSRHAGPGPRHGLGGRCARGHSRRRTGDSMGATRRRRL